MIMGILKDMFRKQKFVETGWRKCKIVGCGEKCGHMKEHKFNTACRNPCMHSENELPCIMCEKPEESEYERAGLT
jgi:hypothetical protein